ncbi:hypothetical protein [Enterovirga rhinocerotis]|nr:hypothetical protein [Enterovirga rhinocerotis]
MRAPLFSASRRHDGMVEADLAGHSLDEVMHDKQFEAINVKAT